MEIQITKGILAPRTNLVYHVDVEKRPSGNSSHTSTLYEASEEIPPHQWPKIFHSSGEGYVALSDTLTFLDLLLDLNDLAQTDIEMASWLFESESGPTGTYQLRYQVRDQVTYIKNHGEPEFRPLHKTGKDGSNVVSISNG